MQNYLLRAMGIFLFLACMPFNSRAQYFLPLPSDVEEFEKRILVVRLSEIDEKTEKSYKKNPEGLKALKISVQEHNDFLKKHVPEMWPFEQDIEFKKLSEVNQIIKNKDTRYAVLVCRWINELDLQRKKGIDKTTITTIEFRGFSVYAFLAENGNKAVDVATQMIIKRGNYLFKVTMPHKSLNESDFKIVMAFFNDYVNIAKSESKQQKNYFERNSYVLAKLDPEKSKLLSEKILLIPLESLIIPEDSVSAYYPFPYEVVPWKEYKESLTNDKEGKYAYYSVVFNEEIRKWSWFIIDNKDSRLLNIQTTYLPKSFFKRFKENFWESNSFATIMNEEVIVINEIHLNNLTEAIKGKGK